MICVLHLVSLFCSRIEHKLIDNIAFVCVVASINAFVNMGDSSHEAQKQGQDDQGQDQQIYCREEH